MFDAGYFVVFCRAINLSQTESCGDALNNLTFSHLKNTSGPARLVFSDTFGPFKLYARMANDDDINLVKTWRLTAIYK